MSLLGQIVTHNQSLQSGVIAPHNATITVAFAERDISNRSPDAGSLVGRMVLFDVVQTANGLVAVNVRLVRKRVLSPGGYPILIIAPLLVLGAAYGLQYQMQWPLLHSYVVAVNLVGFMLSVVIASRPLTYGTRPADVALFVVAAAGGAISVFFASCLVRSKFRTDAGRFALFVLIVTQLILLYRYSPAFFSDESLRAFLRGS